MSRKPKAFFSKQGSDARLKAPNTSTRSSIESAVRKVVPWLKPKAKLNKRFNRLETESEHIYCTDYGLEPFEDFKFAGWIKCRLIHGQGYSLIAPDQIYFNDESLKWIQPIAFAPCVLSLISESNIHCVVHVDISCGYTIKIEFHANDFVRDLADGSQLFRCEISGVQDLYEFATGDAEWNSDGVPYLRLFHHTTKETCPKILDSGVFRTGPYNIQGTTKRLKNVAYGYFTPLNEIRFSEDLKMIAMDIEGEIVLMRDGFAKPFLLPPDYQEKYKEHILVLSVYECSVAKREANLDVWIDASVLAPQHLYRHRGNGHDYYEYPHLYIQRVGTLPDHLVHFDSNRRIHHQDGLKSFDYIVVGDCTTLEGLAAPYDEEDTTHTMKIERMPTGTNMLSFWFENANTDLFTGKNVEMQEFQPPEGADSKVQRPPQLFS